MELNDRLKMLRLYELYEQPMYRIAYAVLNDSGLAEDAVHDAFVRIMGKMDRLDDPDSPRTKKYIVKVIRSTSINIYRRNKRRAAFEQPIDERTMQLPDSVEYFSKAADTSALLRDIGETDKKIVMLRCQCGMSWKEVADRVELKESAVRKRFERARKKIIKQRGESYEEF